MQRILTYGFLNSIFRLPQSKYVIVLHSDLLSRVVHLDEPPFLFLDGVAATGDDVA